MKHGCCRAGFEREKNIGTVRDGETGQRRGGRGDVQSHGTAISARVPYWAMGTEDLILSVYHKGLMSDLSGTRVSSLLHQFTNPTSVDHREPRMPNREP
jgi:hypothetical protein